jgi:hypothetical protein
MADIKLGSVVTDMATGYTGTVTGRVEFLNGNIQYSVIPKAKAGVGEYPAGVNLDGAQLKVTGKGISDTEVLPQPTNIKLGEKIKDIITGMSGIVTSKTVFLNGCVYFLVSSIDPVKKIPLEMFISLERVERVSSGVTAKLAKAEKPTGGPATRVMRAC